MAAGHVEERYRQEAHPLRRVGIDLDTLGSDLTTAKKVRRVYPLVYSYDATVPVQVLLGGAMYPSQPPRYLAPGDTVEQGIDGLGQQRHRVIQRKV